MKQYEKDEYQAYLNSEKATIAAIKKTYEDALEQVDEKIRVLSTRTDIENMPTIIHQKKYQEQIKGQLEDILGKLQEKQYKTVNDYLNDCYTEGFLRTMYSLNQQGIPFAWPIDQKAVEKAVVLDSKISGGLYAKLGVDIKSFKKSISSEISRGIASSLSYSEIARNLKNASSVPISNASRIVRTEGHRIQNQAKLDSMHEAKKKGADVVKQWDATLDGTTRPTHRELDGQIREIDEDFEVGGMRADVPGNFGDPAEDCNCRCTCLTRARWALDDGFTKMDNSTKELRTFESPKSYEEFKKEYWSDKSIAGADSGSVRSNVQKMKMSSKATDSIWDAKGEKITKDQYKDLMKYARNNNIELSGFKAYDGKIETIKDMIDDAHSVAKLYPEITSGRKKLTIKLDTLMADVDFAKTEGHIVRINANAFRNVDILEREYQKLVEEKWFVQGTDYHGIIKHELGHVVSNHYNVDCLKIAKEITGINKDAYLLDYLEGSLSQYAASYADGREIISECFASVYNSNIENEFALKFVEKYGNIISNK